MKTNPKPKKIKIKPKMPKVVSRTSKTKDIGGFPVTHYSYSSMASFSTNPIMFKIQYVNRDRFDTARGISGVIGQAFHKAMEVYAGGEGAPDDTSELVEAGLQTGMEFLNQYNDGFIEFNTDIKTKQKALEVMAFAYNAYVQEREGKEGELISCEEMIEEFVDVEWRGAKLTLPVKLKGYPDKIFKQDGKLKIKDYKTTRAFSAHDKIDGAKILQAITDYLLVYARYGEEPYSITYDEVKTSRNRDGSPQVRSYEMVFADNELYFDFYFRFYEDMTQALNGEMVYVPNINAFYDNEVALIAYIHRLDVTEEQAKLMKKHKVQNITELLQKQIQSAGNMRKLLKTVEQKFVSAKNLNYSKMENHEKIQTKMLEYGMMIQFDSKIEGASVDIYRYTPSIGLKMSKLKAFTEDVEQVMGVSGIRVLAPIPNTSLVGYEVPRRERRFPEIPAGNGFDVAIGEDVMGQPHRYDIRQAPHILVAGASGSGKSVFLNALIEQLTRISNLRLYLFDPKMVELARHKTARNVTEYTDNILDMHLLLQGLVEEMNERYKRLAEKGHRNIQEAGDMDYKVVIIDEFGDIIMQNYEHEETTETGHVFQRGERAGLAETQTTKYNLSAEISKNILLLAQKARAAGIHLVITTQRPSTDIITGTIKANFPVKVAFRTAKAVDSTVILDEVGAEKLMGKGDMLFTSDEGIVRLQGYNTN
jgi:energy-coupling factor transporter ATP-binding protein EcfA2